LNIDFLIHVQLERSHPAISVTQLVSNLIDSTLRQLEFVVGSQGELDVRDSNDLISSVQLGLYNVVPDGLGSDLKHYFLVEVRQVVGGLQVGDDCLESLHSNSNFLSNIAMDQHVFVQQLLHE
jgi:hypothetical protein